MWHAFIGSMHLSSLGATPFLCVLLYFCCHAFFGSWIFSLMAHPRGNTSFYPHFFVARAFVGTLEEMTFDLECF
jgi:hypothetical protein